MNENMDANNSTDTGVSIKMPTEEQINAEKEKLGSLRDEGITEVKRLNKLETKYKMLQAIDMLLGIFITAATGAILLINSISVWWIAVGLVFSICMGISIYIETKEETRKINLSTKSSEVTRWMFEMDYYIFLERAVNNKINILDASINEAGKLRVEYEFEWSNNVQISTFFVGNFKQDVINSDTVKNEIDFTTKTIRTKYRRAMALK